MSRARVCCVALPRAAMGLSAVYDCGIYYYFCKPIKSGCEYGVVHFTEKFLRGTHVDIPMGEKEAVKPKLSKYL